MTTTRKLKPGAVHAHAAKVKGQLRIIHGPEMNKFVLLLLSRGTVLLRQQNV